MPLGQKVVIGGLNFQFIRILLVIGWCRVLSRGEARDFRLNSLDKLFLWWALVGVVLGTLSQPTFGRFINRSGEAFNAAGTYFLMRCWIHSLDDVIGTVRFASWMVVPLALLMLVEKLTGRNAFAAFGGVLEFTEVRDGKLRCQGPFAHPILAGTYGVTLLPVFAGLYFLSAVDRSRAAIGGVSAAIITLASASSGALMALLAVAVGWPLWFFRARMRLVRWGILLLLVMLHLTMKVPVWWIIARLSELVGGTGWHRSYLIDQAIKHVGEWWLVGSTYTAHWAPYPGLVLVADPNNMDITNHYISEALGGGIWRLGLFILIITKAFRTIGQNVRKFARVDRSRALFLWGLGVCLATHCISFLSITYFDQIVIMWYWLLGAISMFLTPPRALLRKAEFAPVSEPFREVQSGSCTV